MENWLDGRCKRLELDMSDIDGALPVLHALSTELRLKLLRELWKGSRSVNELARALDVPVSTAALNVQILERAGLVSCEMRPGVRGMVKLCSRLVSGLTLNMERREDPRQVVRSFEMPVGCYSTVSDVEPTCGLAGCERNFEMDMLGAFYHPQRFEAELLWMHAGTVEYRFPGVSDPEIDFLEISYEACSETRTYCNDYPSDIFTEVNGVRLGIWRSPGDFGGRRGFLNPEWWSDSNTQYGHLLTWRVDNEGTTRDNVRVSDVTLKDLNLRAKDYIGLRIGVTGERGIVGGMNLFGKRFGDSPQGIVMRCGFLSNENRTENME